MSASKGRMLNRVSHWCEDSDLSNAKTKRQRRARGEREWRKSAEQEYLDAVWAAYYEDTRRLADDFGRRQRLRKELRQERHGNPDAFRREHVWRRNGRQ